MTEQILAGLRVALRALRANKMRSALTMLGVIIGVAAVIAMVAIGTGATARVQSEIQSIGSNLLIVMSGSMTSNGVRLGGGAAVTLSDDDASAIAELCPAVAYAAPTVRGGVQVVSGGNNWATQLQGTTPDYLAIRDLSIDSGRAFTQDDVQGATKVALLGKTVVQNLFPNTDAVGQDIRIKGVPFTVAGVLSPKGQSPSGQDQDDVILVPFTTARQKVLGGNKANARAVGTILVQARDAAQLEMAQQEIEALLRQRHHIQPRQSDDFTVRNLTEVFKAEESSSRVMSILLGAIASVSLIVGGIGIMNIMLVSVTERTREIGIRMAMGAKTKNILTQFLVEAVTLSIIGGTIGILLGVGTSFLIAFLAKWSTLVSTTSILLAFAFSALVGIFFGYYPARKAAFLDPIEALRYE